MRWRLATFNIEYCVEKRWLLKRDALIDLLRGLRSDFLCLQEVTASGLRWIREQLDHPHYVGAGRNDGADNGEHVPILLLGSGWEVRESGTFWFSPTQDRPSRGWNASSPRICTWTRVERSDDPRRKLAIFNLHLDHRSRRARQESIRLLRSRVAKVPASCPVIICGDFNFRPGSKSYNLLREDDRGFADGALEIPDGSGPPRPTWDGFGPWSFGRGRIDYVFADRMIQVLHYEVADNHIRWRRLSDHHPVWIDFSLR